jgi:hypothetical protein
MLVVTPVRGEGPATGEPKVAEATLENIGTYLRRYMSHSVERLHVRNPSYEYVRVGAWVTLAPGEDASSLGRLDRSLERFIAPWRFDDRAPMAIGTASLSVKALYAYLEQEAYLSRVTRLSLVHTFRRQGGGTGRERWGLRDTARAANPMADVMVQASSPWSVLVPAPQHRIGILQAGLGNVEVSGDLVVAAENDPSAQFTWRPSKAGVGNLRIGSELIVTSECDVQGLSTPPGNGLTGLDARFLERLGS